jgi:predicted DNA-binding transcriptional regulator AlpA
MPEMNKEHFTYGSVPQQSKRCGISTAHYYREMNKGNLPKGKKIGGRRIICDQEVDGRLLEGDNDE